MPSSRAAQKTLKQIELNTKTCSLGHIVELRELPAAKHSQNFIPRLARGER